MLSNIASLLGRVKAVVDIFSCGLSSAHLCETPHMECGGRLGEQEIARDWKLVIFRVGKKNLSQVVFYIEIPEQNENMPSNFGGESC